MARQRTIIEILENNEHNALLLGFTKNINTFLYEHRNAQPTEKNYLDAAEFMSETAGFEINMERAKGILDLYPHARIKLAVYNGLGDTEVCDLVLSAMSNFFLGCDWVTYGDKVDLTIFLAALHKQAVAMDFTK
jgi:hypothetical protein